VLDYGLIFKVAGMGIIVAMIFTVLKQAGREEHGHLVTLVGVVLVLAMALKLVKDLFSSVRTMFNLY
jgi:stage III sporulation protein AC